MKTVVQRAGMWALVLALAAVLFLGWTLAAAAILVLVLVSDLTLYLTGQTTISAFVWRLFVPLEDMAVMTGLLALTWLTAGLDMAVVYVLGVISGHLFWQCRGGAD